MLGNVSSVAQKKTMCVFEGPVSVYIYVSYYVLDIGDETEFTKLSGVSWVSRVHPFT